MSRALWPVAAVVAVSVAAQVFAPAASADDALWVQGSSPREIPVAEVLKRVPPGYALRQIDYPHSLWPFTGPFTPTGGQSIAAGVAALDAALDESVDAGRTLVIGESLGAMVVDQELRELAARPDAPDPSTVRFEVIASPVRPGGLISYLPVGFIDPITWTVVKPVPETPYDVTVLKLQYDGIASFPDRPWHLLSVANAVLGALFYHPSAHYSAAAQDLINGRIPAENTVSTVNSLGGVTTTYTVQQNPAFLYLLEPFFPEAVAAVNSVLTPIVNLGYSELTPDAGPHLATGGQLVDKNGQPVFRFRFPVGPGESTAPRASVGPVSPAATRQVMARPAEARPRPTAGKPRTAAADTRSAARHRASA